MCLGGKGFLLVEDPWLRARLRWKKAQGESRGPHCWRKAEWQHTQPPRLPCMSLWSTLVLTDSPSGPLSTMRGSLRSVVPLLCFSESSSYWDRMCLPGTYPTSPPTGPRGRPNPPSREGTPCDSDSRVPWPIDWLQLRARCCTHRGGCGAGLFLRPLNRNF